MAAHRMVWHKGLQRCAQLTRKLGLAHRLSGSKNSDRLAGEKLLDIPGLPIRARCWPPRASSRPAPSQSIRLPPNAFDETQ